jgi:hypothetical protein
MKLALGGEQRLAQWDNVGGAAVKASPAAWDEHVVADVNEFPKFRNPTNDFLSQLRTSTNGF